MNEKMKKRDIITLTVFIFVTITSGIFGHLLAQQLPKQPVGTLLGMGLWLILPFLTGIVLQYINNDLKQLGSRPNFKNNSKWYAVAFLTFPCTTLISIIAAKIGGGLAVGDIVLGTLFISMFSTFFINCIKNIFEEFAWRGCLVPYLEKTGMNDWILYFSSGLIWGIWQITYYILFLPNEYFIKNSRLMIVVIGIILMIFWSPLFVELRRLTNSVWPCIVLHSMETAVPNMLFVTTHTLQISKNYSILLDPIFGIIPTGLIFFIGLKLRKHRIEKEATMNVKTKETHSECERRML